MKALLAILVIGAVSCADDSTDSGNVLELRMQSTIPAGTEAEYCKFVEVPDTWVTRDSIEFTAGSHHVLVYQTAYASIPTAKDDGTPVDTSGVFDCTDGATNGWSVTKLLGGSQNREGDSILKFPPGVGVHIGGVALINVHYINPTDDTLETDVRIRFDTVPASKVVEEGDILFLYNPLISVPAGRTARAHWRCPVYRDITIANVQSHMHARGIGYQARVDAEQPFYTTTKWESVPVQSYDSFVVKAGSKLDYYCDYRSTEPRNVYQGPRSTDEMCMLIGSYYPADPRTGTCLDEAGVGTGGEWVGQGTATCKATLGCLQGATELPAVTDCMLAAKPEVAAEASAVLRCILSAHDAEVECGSQIQACSAL